jgi:hypothetical protein
MAIGNMEMGNKAGLAVFYGRWIIWPRLLVAISRSLAKPAAGGQRMTWASPACIMTCYNLQRRIKYEDKLVLYKVMLCNLERTLERQHLSDLE